MIAILKTMLRDHGTSLVECLLLASVAMIALTGAKAIGNGVHRDSATNSGLYRRSIYTDGIYRYAAADSGQVAETDASGQGSQVYVDGGNGVFSGSVTAQAFVQGLRTRDGSDVAASVSLAPVATIEDSGTGRLESGKGIIRFDQAFAGTIDFRSGYQVFLSADGETRGLYVAAKYERGFVVRETEHGRSSIYFDYRILAHPMGTSDVRLPQLGASVTTNGL
ncbi:MAG: hypothetical protein WA215_09335 [Candidatus Cybelea sp.]